MKKSGSGSPFELYWRAWRLLMMAAQKLHHWDKGEVLHSMPVSFP